ncbi:MAG: isoprenylcysteine carboxylmethyltransferase family protein [Bacteroidetes bacterium]|nr:isoprenylcysteine carboxylmethyltransferase family protein [Bacteroidota bacterium]
MSTKRHTGHPHLTGEHRWGDTIQLLLLLVFLGIWITDSFVFRYSTFLNEVIPDFIRIPFAAMVLFPGWILARRGMKAVFGTKRENPEVINTGVFKVIRHPIYTGALLFYLGAILITLSLVSAAFWILVVAFYIIIARYEERILTEEFGEKYTAYKKQTGMLFPRLFHRSA